MARACPENWLKSSESDVAQLEVNDAVASSGRQFWMLVLACQS
jgi:hypothetical protein